VFGERENADNFLKDADNLLKSTWDAALRRRLTALRQ